jgi:hypothetical protein
MRFAPKVRFGLMFVVHQMIALWVVIVSAGILTASVLNFLGLLGWHHPRSAYGWLLSANPYFPVQIALALLLGWLLGRSLRDRSMTWVWLFPPVSLGYALVMIPTLIPQFVRPAFQAGIGQSRLSHYFGWGCQSGNYCLDQNSFTRPFYASVAYSLAALIALKTLTRSRRSAIAHYWMVLVAGMLFVAASISDSIQSVRAGGWHWHYLYLEGTPAAMGMYLILLAFSTRRKPTCSEAVANDSALLS